MRYYRLIVAVAIGIAAALAAAFWRGDTGDLPLCLAHAILEGQPPYAACPIQHGIAQDALPAALIVLPMIWLPPALLAALWIGGSAGLLAYGLREPWRLLLFASVGSMMVIYNIQWGFLLCAVALYPALMPLALGKPHTGLALFLWRPSWRRALTCVAVLALSLLISPSWPLDFLAQARAYTETDGGFVPILYAPWLALAAFRWRDDRVRLLLLMACVPQRGYYNALPLLLLPRTPREMAIAVAAQWLSLPLALWAGWPIGMLVGCYLPILAFVFRVAWRDWSRGLCSAVSRSRPPSRR